MQVPVSQLQHHPLNAEIYSLSSIDDLVSSIGEVGLLQSLVINNRNEVLSGNRRLEAIRKLGWQKVEVDVVETDAEKELIVHYNKQRIKSCKELLNEFAVLLPQYEVGQGKRTDLTNVPRNKSCSARDKIADLIGVSSSQIGKLLFIQKTDPNYIDLIDDGVLTISQAYLTLSRVKNQQESLVEISPEEHENTDEYVFHHKSSHQMVELADKSVDCIFTSPPYWNKRNYVEGGGLGNEQTDKEFVSNLVSHLQDCKRILKDDGSFFLVLGDTFQNSNLLNIPHRVVIGLQEQGWILRNTIVALAWKAQVTAGP